MMLESTASSLRESELVARHRRPNSGATLLHNPARYLACEVFSTSPAPCTTGDGNELVHLFRERPLRVRSDELVPPLVEGEFLMKCQLRRCVDG